MQGKFRVIGILDEWKKGDMPGNQMVNIVLNGHFRLNDGSVALTAQLATDSEVDYAIDQLIKELEMIRKKAKDNIKKTNKKIRDSL
ncbi:MAG: hypothetical protein M1547_00575 [Gammaproteobacteria bacterium]|nr:hypothetical protein [Gammaproteobacteria bacterium]